MECFLLCPRQVNCIWTTTTAKKFCLSAPSLRKIRSIYKERMVSFFVSVTMETLLSTLLGFSLHLDFHLRTCIVFVSLELSGRREAHTCKLLKQGIASLVLLSSGVRKQSFLFWLCYVKLVLRSWSYGYLGKYLRCHEWCNFGNNALIWRKVPMDVCGASRTENASSWCSVQKVLFLKRGVDATTTKEPFWWVNAEEVCIGSFAHKLYRLLEKPGFCWRARDSFFSWEKKKWIMMYLYFSQKAWSLSPSFFF